ncbi:MAG: hypothetical protein ACRDJH_04985 [Thermomicrobiales bacterium]
MATQIELNDIAIDNSDFLRRVREADSPVDLVDHGEVVAHLLPVRRVSEAERARAWAALDDLVAELGRRDVGDVSAVEKVRDVRRDLLSR